MLPLAGIPLVGHAVECAARVERIGCTVVSTDDEEIAAVAERFGAEVVRRPAELARDDTPTWPVVRHALERCGAGFDLLVLLEPTDPLRLPEDVDAAIDVALGQPDADGVVSVSEPRFNPVFQGVRLDGGRVRPLFPDALLERRQDAPAVYYVNGCVYVWRTTFVRAHGGHWLEGDTLALVTPESRSVSVDRADDLKLCEALLASGRASLPWL